MNLSPGAPDTLALTPSDGLFSPLACSDTDVACSDSLPCSESGIASESTDTLALTPET